MIVRPARRLCATSLAVLMLGGSLAHAQATPEAAIAQAEAMGLCDPTLPAGVRLPGRLIGCTPQQAARMGMPAGGATGMAGGGLMGGAGPGGISVGGGDPLNMGPGPAPNPGPGPKGPGAPKGPGGGPLMPGPGGPTLPSGMSNDIFDRAAADRMLAEQRARDRAEAEQADRTMAEADRAYDQMEADMLEAMQADKDSAEARAADKKMRAEMARLRAERDAEKKKKYDLAKAEYQACIEKAPAKYALAMLNIANEYNKQIVGAKPELIAVLKAKRAQQEDAVLWQRDHDCHDYYNPDNVPPELAPLPPKKK